MGYPYLFTCFWATLHARLVNVFDRIVRVRLRPGNQFCGQNRQKLVGVAMSVEGSKN